MPTFTGTPGDDTLNGGSGPDTIDGLAGNDVLEGSDGADTINGGDGNDILYAGTISPPWAIPSQGVYGRPLLDIGTDRDTLNGGAGFDLIFAGYGDMVDGGADNDALYVSFLGAAAGVTFNIRLGNQTIGGATIAGIEFVNWLQGSNFDDILDLRMEDQNAETGGGAIEGMGGNDHITAGRNTEILDGGAGDDHLEGRFSVRLQAIFGGEGDDTLLPTWNAQAFGGPGNDTIHGMRFSDGGDGNDTINMIQVQGTGGGGLALGGAGDDTITGTEESFFTGDYIAGGAGADYIDGLQGNDFLGSEGFDDNPNVRRPTHDFGSEYDQIIGGAGNDQIWIGYGDSAIGGPGTDTLHLSLAGFGAGIIFTTAGLLGSIGRAIGAGGVAEFEILASLIGTDFNDDLTIDFQSTAITVDAAGGNDVIRSSAAGTVLGGSGNDRLLGFTTLFDGGEGVDTIDRSTATFNSIVTLGENGAAGTSSGSIQLISVENIVGSNSPDQLTGNAEANAIQGGGGNDIITGRLGLDQLTGGSGADSFRDTAAGLNGDTIVDLSSGDRIVIADAVLAGFSFSLNGNVLSFTGGSVTLASVPAGPLAATYTENGEVQIGYEAATVIENDYNGDGRSDILWRHTDGTIGLWQGNGNATFSSVASSVSAVSNYWTIASLGDFNADGRDDILWRGANGEVGNWLGNGSGGFAYNAAAGVTTIPNSWQIAGVGDFNQDGRDDILWRNVDGTIGTWAANANGGFTSLAQTYGVSNDWQIVAIGDFSGSTLGLGNDDILWRHTDGTIGYWYGAGAYGAGFDTSGQFIANSNVVSVSNDWHVIGAGDFNGDGRDDILWRHDSGTVANWFGNSNGTFTPNFASLVTITEDWNVASIGDYNGDGRDDILWRHDSGTVANWLANTDNSATFTTNGASFAGVPNEWQVQDPATLFL